MKYNEMVSGMMMGRVSMNKSSQDWSSRYLNDMIARMKQEHSLELGAGDGRGVSVYNGERTRSMFAVLE
jgi:hypothetical protein